MLARRRAGGGSTEAPREARAAAQTLHERGRAVFLTGGTGLYIRAFLEGLLEAGGADPELRQTLEREHARALDAGHATLLYERLVARDPEAALTIHPHDLRRIVRALEICERSGGAASALRRAHGFGDRPYRSLHLAIDPGRQALDARIDAHCRQKIDAGLEGQPNEVRRKVLFENAASLYRVEAPDAPPAAAR